MRTTTSTLASHLRVSVARLARRLRQEGMREDTTPSQLTTLSTLYRIGPLTLGELAATERVKPPTMTRIVAALEERGLVRREASTHDGRIVNVVVTDDGRAAHEEYSKRRDAWLCRRLNDLPPEDRKTLLRAADVLDRLGEP